MAGSDFIRLFWALSKWMAGSYGNRSTEHSRRIIQHRIKTVIQKQRGGWRKRVCPKPTINMRTVSTVWVSQDLDTLDILLIYSLHLTLLFLHNVWHHLSYLTVFTWSQSPLITLSAQRSRSLPMLFSVVFPAAPPVLGIQTWGGLGTGGSCSFLGDSSVQSEQRVGRSS